MIFGKLLAYRQSGAGGRRVNKLCGGETELEIDVIPSSAACWLVDLPWPLLGSNFGGQNRIFDD